MDHGFPSDIETFLASSPIPALARRLLVHAVASESDADPQDGASNASPPLACPSWTNLDDTPRPLFLDGGMARFRKAVRLLPTADSRQEPDPLWRELQQTYVEKLRQPLFLSRQATLIGGHAPTPPGIAAAYIPQAYRMVSHTPDHRHYDDPGFWEQVELRQDLGHFLMAWLLSDQAAQKPLVILGATGSGKTLLTRILAGHLSFSIFLPVRLMLGGVDARATIQLQIEEQLRQDLGRKIEWSALSRSGRAHRPVVLLDGMNELLGAHERVFRDYPEKALRFQELEASLGRPVRLILTSRSEVIDRADLPDGACVLRLDPFDTVRRVRWIRLWNRANRGYFRASGVQPLHVPDIPSLQQLASIPFFLSLLAVLDADGNPLHECEAMSSFELYQRIVRRFVARTLPPGTPDEQLHQEQKRLGAVAMGMFHRHTLSIRADEVATDAPFFPHAPDIEPQQGISPDPSLPNLLEKLFFVHVETGDKRARSVRLGRDKEPIQSRFAFWHASFGEFLTADYLLRVTRDEAQRICRERRGRNRALRKLAEERFRDPLTTPTVWMAPLIHTPLMDRPGVLSMLRERVKGCWLIEKGERGQGMD
ncbi:MAG: ATP-binding protein, partial [Magnetococcales bacterium]|nr:ATP-binding protein [Magnetococcales bacterium]